METGVYQLRRFNDMRSMLLAFIISVLGCAHAAAQVGGIAGTVKDSSGRFCPAHASR